MAKKNATIYDVANISKLKFHNKQNITKIIKLILIKFFINFFYTSKYFFIDIELPIIPIPIPKTAYTHAIVFDNS